MEEQSSKKELKTSDEFRFLIPVTLSKDKYRQHEENLIKDTNPAEPIVLYTWNGTLIDEYDTYDICQNHNIPFRIVEKQFADIDEAKLWVINIHLAMPTYPAFVRIELAIKRDDILRRKEQAKQRMVEASHPKKTTDDAFVNSQNQLPEKIADSIDDASNPINVTKEVAQQINVGEQAVSHSIQIIKKAPEDVKEKLRRDEISIHQAYQELKKREKELEELKQEKNGLSETMRELSKDVHISKIMTKFLKQMESFLKRVPSFNSEQLNLILARMQEACTLIEAEIEKSKLNSEQPPQPPAPTDSQTTILPSEPEPT